MIRTEWTKRVAREEEASEEHATRREEGLTDRRLREKRGEKGIQGKRVSSTNEGSSREGRKGGRVEERVRVGRKGRSGQQDRVSAFLRGSQTSKIANQTTSSR